MREPTVGQCAFLVTQSLCVIKHHVSHYFTPDEVSGVRWIDVFMEANLPSCNMRRPAMAWLTIAIDGKNLTTQAL
jgi:hypothetical protein